MKVEGWITLVALAIVANTLIMIYLFPTKRPDYWWLPGALIWFMIYDYLWTPVRDFIWPPIDPTKPRWVLPRIA
jgi:hypothetical protein